MTHEARSVLELAVGLGVVVLLSVVGPALVEARPRRVFGSPRFRWPSFAAAV